ncbi:MAG: hypothetical protein Q8S42_27905, partial [Archangium sp.]|nr:hypothetical protein [Archangium sp.]
SDGGDRQPRPEGHRPSASATRKDPAAQWRLIRLQRIYPATSWIESARGSLKQLARQHMSMHSQLSVLGTALASFVPRDFSR